MMSMAKIKIKIRVVLSSTKNIKSAWEFSNAYDNVCYLPQIACSSIMVNVEHGILILV